MDLRVLHQPYEPFAYALNQTTARIVLLVGRGAVHHVELHSGDRYQMKLQSCQSMKYVGEDGTFDVFEADVEIPTSRLKYTFELKHSAEVRMDPQSDSADEDMESLWLGESGLSDNSERAGVFQLPYLCQRDVFDVPEWTANAVCYQIFPERFANGDDALTPDGADDWDADPTQSNMLGGDIPGVREKLNYLADLGVNMIYFTPIFKAQSNHKYDTSDYYEIDPQFGTKDDFRALVEDAHARGIRVVLDAVFNHSGAGFAPFQDVVKNGAASPYWDWFFIHGERLDTENVNYETFSNQLAGMPKLNVAHPEVESYLLDVAAYWIREFDIDGWRLDVANEIDHVFWRKFRTTVKAAKPDALILGEVWHNSLPWLRGDEFDGVMNYLFRDYGLGFLVDKTLTGTEFAQKLVQLLHLYPVQAASAGLNLLGSHDTERVLTHAKSDKDAVLRAFTYQFTYPGIPMVYYGDEIGMEGETDPGCRAGMVWDSTKQNLQLRGAVQKLIQIRRNHPALQTTELQIVAATDTYVEYLRRGHDGTAVHVAFNTGDASCHVSCHGKVLFDSSSVRRSAGAIPGEEADKLSPGACMIWEP
ncbi:glycoside hydrolase family 13 protein [Alicyclobacillus sp. SO9]|uniref:glycoside hydrolase family 13 protein n=1 Tax=Alicyclobacillus sp. SO9 TaxID=2665646 RepID=UPI0018E7C540|nr:glycoside hydrolase family 13 protein [Alicyclobacillus sp. SO9]QQE78640.1 glycoside hydrolase family 13 protein [Alicyclobacillus sp. SO9]